MIESWQRRFFGKHAAVAAAALAGLSTAAFAGNGRLLSQWMRRAPRIDGQIAPGEWDAAKLLDLGGGVTVRLGNDARTFYLAALDAGDTSASGDDLFFPMFDDEGGPRPILDDDDFASPACQASANLGEGELVFSSNRRASAI